MNEVICDLLKAESYPVISFSDATDFLSWFEIFSDDCSVIVSDVQMPNMSGFDLCRRMRERLDKDRIPIILLTGYGAGEQAAGIDAGADYFIEKPFKKLEFLAKVKSLVEIRNKDRKLNALLTEVSNCLSPVVATLMRSEESKSMLQLHQTHVTVLFTDIRGFTSFANTVRPEDVMEVLRKYYEAVGHAALKFSGTLGSIAGDGIMVFFNDPIPQEGHQQVALQMAMETRKQLEIQRIDWRGRGFEIDFGIGVAEGEATIGKIGLEKFWQYSVIGPVSNLAARLCKTAHQGQILVSERYFEKFGRGNFRSESVGELELKGMPTKVKAVNILETTIGPDKV